jgi:hypothetical protein
MKATYWFEKAANQGDLDSQYNLGVLYEKGIGTDKDLNKALFWFIKSAENNYSLSQYSLGVLYFSNEGVTKDNAKSAYWIRKAYDSGDERAEKYWNKMELWKY